MTLLNIQEVASLMRCSVCTIRRRMTEARKGNSTFPLPIHGDKKRGLWRKDDIILWSEAPPPNAPHIESPSVRHRRLEIVQNQLRAMGVTIGNQE